MSSVSALRWEDRTVRGGICLVLCVVTAAYLLPFVDRGWIAHDDGMLGQMAERVLAGEIPHRDFDDPYTGGLTYLHALGFKLFGVRLLSLRWLLFAATLAWVPVVYFLAVRFVPPAVAALVTAVAVTWSLPNYFASMPSYYNLFLATLGTAALFRHIERGGRGWLVLAGLCGGVSFLVKSVGVFFLVAGGLFLLFRAQTQDGQDAQPDARPSTGFLLLEAAGCLVLVTALVSLVGERRTVMNVLHFVAPLAAVVGVLLWSEWREGRGALGTRVRRAWALLWPFAAGAVVPVAIFLLPYIATGTTGAFSDGVFLALDRRLGQAERSLPPAGNLAWALPYGAVLLAVALGWRVRWSVTAAIVAGLGFVAALATVDRDVSYLALWNSARFLPVFAMLAGCVLLLCRPLSLSSIQTPASLPASGGAGGDRPGAVSVFRAYLLLLHSADAASCRAARGQPGSAPPPSGSAGGIPHLRRRVSQCRLRLEHRRRPSTRISGHECQPADSGPYPYPSGRRKEYFALLSEIRTRVPAGEYVFATPDCPEVYFLSGVRNPTRDLYEFLGGPPRGKEETLALIERHRIRLIVINREPHFSGPIDSALEMALESRFPLSAVVGRFVVRWRV